MKKIFLTIAFIATGLVASAQVGVGNTDPKVTLHVTGTNDNGAVTGVDGVLVPRVNDANMASAAAGTEDGQLVYNTVAKAFYYWNAGTSAWTAVGAAQPYQNLRGKRTTFTGLAYVLAADDFIVASVDAVATTITLPTLTAAEIGRIIVIQNLNTTGNVTVSATPAVPFTTVIPNRVRTYMWFGDRWNQIVP